MRKVKFCQDTIDEKLGEIIDGFPKLDDIHPFYADIIHILYDRDHYKLALGHVNKAKSLVDNVANDYVRLLKYADSLYRAKALKRAALGRYATILKKLKASLGYLEEVRKHMGRLPQIDTNARTLLITGYPNVGKSSFMNNITSANVDVQSYAFTTQNLFVGHTQHKYATWQVIDSPGLLDHPIEDRNVIEMQSITALAHLNACILFFIDISGTCGYTIEQQVQLFNSIKVLFSDKPLVIVLNKVDIQPFEQLSKEEKTMLNNLAKDSNSYLIKMSNHDGTGITDVKEKSCDILLDYRLSKKKDTTKIENRLHVALPKKGDNKKRGPNIPESVIMGIKKDGPTIKELQEKYGGAGVYSFPIEEHYKLANDEWKMDNWPELFNGKNVLDFYDEDIEQKLNDLEKEEELLMQ